MEKLLIICEKPSAAKNFATALGGQQGTFDGQPYSIVALYGHILKNPEPEKTATDRYKETVGGFSHIEGLPWKPEYFDFNHKVIINEKGFDGPKNAYASVKQYLNQGYTPVIATDLDDLREGDVIGHEVLNHIGYAGTRYRIHHIDETPKTIVNALKNKHVAKTNGTQVIDTDYQVGFLRSNCDFMTQSLTRMATITLQNKGLKLPTSVPMGRLKSAILVLIGDQLKAIEDYTPSSVWESRYRLDNLVLSAKDMTQYPTQEEWQSDGLPEFAEVKKVKEVQGSTPPPKPLTLSSLSGMTSKKGLSLDATISACQKLYEDGIISYPRTSDTTITPEQFKESLSRIDQLITLMNMPNALFTHRTPRSTHVKSDAVHGALHPGANIPSSIESLDTKYGKGASLVYQLITQNFIVMFLEDTEWVRHEYETVGTNPTFKGSLKVITKAGITHDEDEKEETVTTLPNLSDMATLYPHEVKSTKPTNPSIDWVLKQLEKHDVGTPATQASTLRDLTGKDDNFPIITGKILALSPIGKVGYFAAKGTIIGSIDGTKKLQALLKDVSKGATDSLSALVEFSNLIASDIEHLRIKQYPLELIQFPKVGERASGVWKGQNVTFFKQYGSHTFSDDEVQSLLNDEVIEFSTTSKEGKEYQVSGKLDIVETNGKRYVKFVGKVKKDGVNGIWNGQEVTINPVFMNHTFTPQELEQLFSGETIHIQTEKDGKTYNVSGKLANLTFKGKAYVGFDATFESNREPKDYYSGTWKGKQVTFKRHFMNHYFDDEECARLCRGEELSFKGKSKAGKEMTVKGSLGISTYNGKKFVAFVPDFGK